MLTRNAGPQCDLAVNLIANLASFGIHHHLMLIHVMCLSSLLQPPDPSALLSTVATLVLQARLREAGSIDVCVDATPTSLLSGGVDGVRVRGRGWCTPLRLSCSALDMDVGATAIDPSALLTQRKIVLKRPALGRAQIHFRDADWDSFLVHPLMDSAIDARRATAAAAAPAVVSFARARSRIRPPSASSQSGAVEFTLMWGGEALRARLTQSVADGQVSVIARPLTTRNDVDAATKGSGGEQMAKASADAAAAWLAGLFAALVIDLDGCELSFRRLKVVTSAAPSGDTAAASAAAELSLNLDVCVRSFPSPAINF